MQSRTMNRWSLCKTIMAMGVLAVIRPFHQIAAGGPSKTHADDAFRVCTCRPRLLNDGVTFLREPRRIMNVTEN